MTTVLGVPPTKLIEAVAAELKKDTKIVPPAWTPFVKTGVHRTHPPSDPDWWHIRVAAVLRTVATQGPVGTNTLKVKYGGKQRRGHQKPRFRTGSGKIARMALQQLEAAGFVQQSTLKNQAGKTISKGRILSSKGHSLIDRVAIALSKSE